MRFLKVPKFTSTPGRESCVNKHLDAATWISSFIGLSRGLFANR